VNTPGNRHAARRGTGIATPDIVFSNNLRRDAMLGTILIIVLILLLIGAFPAWPHSRSWGYWPSGSVGLIVVIVVILVLLGRI
jgi:hypothetical protein